MSQSERLKAIVLKRTDYAEADRIIQLLTPQGRRTVIAKGVRRQRSKLAGGIELFAVSDVVIRSGRGQLELLTSAQLTAFYRHIIEDYERMRFAYNALRLVARASEQIDEPGWFEVLMAVFAQLDQPLASRTLTEAWFYLRYASLRGEELNLISDALGQPLRAEKTYMYDSAEPALRPSRQGDITADHIKLLRLMATSPLTALSQLGGIDAVIDQCWLLAQAHAAE